MCPLYARFDRERGGIREGPTLSWTELIFLFLCKNLSGTSDVSQCTCCSLDFPDNFLTFSRLPLLFPFLLLSSCYYFSHIFSCFFFFFFFPSLYVISLPLPLHSLLILLFYASRTQVGVHQPEITMKFEGTVISIQRSCLLSYS